MLRRHALILRPISTTLRLWLLVPPRLQAGGGGAQDWPAAKDESSSGPPPVAGDEVLLGLEAVLKDATGQTSPTGGARRLFVLWAHMRGYAYGSVGADRFDLCGALHGWPIRVGVNR